MVDLIDVHGFISSCVWWCKSSSGYMCWYNSETFVGNSLLCSH